MPSAFRSGFDVRQSGFELLIAPQAHHAEARAQLHMYVEAQEHAEAMHLPLCMLESSLLFPCFPG